MRYFDPNSLMIFVTVCDEGSIVIAAEKVALVPSAVSKRLSAMEEQIGIKLLERSRRGVTPTPAGEVLLRSARETLQSHEKMHSELSEFSHGVQGSLLLLASLSAVCQFLPQQISEFMKMNEKVQITIEERVSSLILRGIEEGRADIGICWEAVHAKDLYTRPYQTDQLALVVNASMPIAQYESIRFENTLDYQYVELLSGSLVSLTLQREAAVLGKQLRYRVHVTTFEAACRMVDSELGVCVIPLEVAKIFERALNIKAIPLEDSWAKRKFIICARSYDKLNYPARLLFDHLSNSNDSPLAGN